MRVEGTRRYEASRDRVWEVLNDPAEMAGLMPGVESFEIVDDTHWKAKVKVPLGLGSMKMSIDFEKTESGRRSTRACTRRARAWGRS